MHSVKRSFIVAAIVGALCVPAFSMAAQANSFGNMNFTGAQLTELRYHPQHPGNPPPPKKKPRPPKKAKKPAPKPHRPDRDRHDDRHDTRRPAPPRYW